MNDCIIQFLFISFTSLLLNYLRCILFLFISPVPPYSSFFINSPVPPIHLPRSPPHKSDTYVHLNSVRTFIQLISTFSTKTGFQKCIAYMLSFPSFSNFQLEHFGRWWGENSINIYSDKQLLCAYGSAFHRGFLCAAFFVLFGVPQWLCILMLRLRESIFF